MNKKDLRILIIRRDGLFIYYVKVMHVVRKTGLLGSVLKGCC